MLVDTEKFGRPSTQYIKVFSRNTSKFLELLCVSIYKGLPLFVYADTLILAAEPLVIF